jgi:hypothetical protein
LQTERKDASNFLKDLEITATVLNVCCRPLMLSSAT